MFRVSDLPHDVFHAKLWDLRRLRSRHDEIGERWHAAAGDAGHPPIGLSRTNMEHITDAGRGWRSTRSEIAIALCLSFTGCRRA